MIGVESNEKERRIVFLEYNVQTRRSIGHLQQWCCRGVCAKRRYNFTEKIDRIYRIKPIKKVLWNPMQSSSRSHFLLCFICHLQFTISHDESPCSGAL